MKQFLFSLLGVFFVGAAGAAAQSTFVVSNAMPGDGQYRDGFLDEMDHSGTGFTDRGNEASLGAGDLMTDNSLNSLSVGVMAAEDSLRRARQIGMFFKLPEMPEGETLEKATLRLFLATKVNSDSELGGLGPVSVFYDTELNEGKIGSPGYGGGMDSGQDLVNSGSELRVWHEVDVTSVVKEDYRNDPAAGYDPVSYFRLQMDNTGAFSEAKGINAYTFPGGTNEGPNKPELVITTAPMATGP